MQYQLFCDFLQSEIIRTQAKKENIFLADLPKVSFDHTEAQEIIDAPLKWTMNDSKTPLEQSL